MSSTQTIQSTDRPQAGVYQIDLAHSSVEAVARHLMITKVRGRLAGLSGVIRVREAAEDSSVEVTIDAATIDTGVADRDAHLRSPDFLDVDNHPTIAYRSTGIRQRGNSEWTVEGELTLRGVTRPVALDLVYQGAGADAFGQERAFFSATTRLRRVDFGITWNQALETGGVVVSDKLDVEIEVSAVRQ